MTGYGIGSSKIGDYSVSVNLQAVNSRFLEQRFRVSSYLMRFENEIRPIIRDRIDRGEVTINAELILSGSSPYMFKVNRPAIEVYRNLIVELQDTGIDVAPMSLRDYLKLDDVIIQEISAESEGMIRDALISALNEALDAIIEMQKNEGSNLEKDILMRIDKIAEAVEKVKKFEKFAPEMVEKRVNKAIEAMNGKFPQDRIAQEVTLTLSKLDIIEEIVRMRSHLDQFRTTIIEEPPVGSKLNFIIQEIHREANTIAAKSQDVRIVAQVIEIKEQTERIREQLRNVQ